MIFNRLFAPAGHDNNLVAPRRQRLFDPVLNDWLVNNRQHFFRLGFGSGKKACAESSSRENCFANFHGHQESLSRELAFCEI